MDITDEIVVWAPAVRALAARALVGIAPGAGIVSTRPARDGRVVVDYEGNLYAAAGMEIYANRVFHAWDRQVADYPTVARMAPRVESLVRVGTFDPVTGEVAVEDHYALRGWLGLDAERPEQLVCTAGRRYVVRREALAMIATGDPARAQTARQWAGREGVAL